MFHQFVPLAHYIHYRSLHSLAYRLILPVPTHRVETLWPEGSRDREGECERTVNPDWTVGQDGLEVSGNEPVVGEYEEGRE